MNTHELNSAGLNEQGTAYALVNLGQVEADLIFYVFEENGMPMHADATINFSTTADLTRIIQIGGVATGITMDTAGNLVDDPTVQIGLALFTLTMNTSSAMTTGVAMGKATTGMALTTAGTLRKKQQLAAAVRITFTTAGNLTLYRRTPIPSASAMLTFTTDATLTNYMALGAVMPTITFDIDALLSALIYLNGQTGITFDVQATLFNNPLGADVDGYVVTRPYVNREVVRTS